MTMTTAGEPAVSTVDGSKAVSERVLIVEDDFLIALTLADAVEEAGGSVIGPASTTTVALGLLALERVRAAAERVARSYGLEVFDVQLRRESVGTVLRVVIDRPDTGVSAGAPADRGEKGGPQR